jgi:hypothetical protein
MLESWEAAAFATLRRAREDGDQPPSQRYGAPGRTEIKGQKSGISPAACRCRGKFNREP